MAGVGRRGESWQLELEVPGYIASAARKQRELNTGTQLILPFYSG